MRIVYEGGVMSGGQPTVYVSDWKAGLSTLDEAVALGIEVGRIVQAIEGCQALNSTHLAEALEMVEWVTAHYGHRCTLLVKPGRSVEVRWGQEGG